MDFAKLPFYGNKILFGRDDEEKIVAVEVDVKSEPCRALLYIRNEDGISTREEEFYPWVIVSTPALLDGFEGNWTQKELSGKGDYRYVIFCNDFNTLRKLLAHLKKRTGMSWGAPNSPYMYYSDLVSQYLITSGKTLFKGMLFGDVVRMQLDIETYSTPEFEFSSAERESDRIIMISMSDSTGWEKVISGVQLDEKQMLKEMVRIIQERDPDVIEGHNLHKFDLPYIETRAKMHKVRLKLGRDGSILKSHNSRINIAERTVVYPKYEINGRHIIDTWLLAQLYDVTARELESYGLKSIAVHFKVAPDDRTYVEGSEIAETFDKDPKTLEKYALDDVIETRAISEILSEPYFIQTQIFPFSYQNVSVRGNATRINSLFVREYVHQARAIPRSPDGRRYAGAYTDIFETGLEKNVLHVDVASLYPSIMLTFNYFPASDSLGIFENLLKDLKDFRLMAKKEMKEADDDRERDFFNNLQATFKILINSFYGYLGFSMGNFSDFDMAEAVTAKGRELISRMLEWLKERGCRPIELDTDGIYFTPPSDVDSEEKEEKLVEDLNDELPEGINLELDGRYRSMFSYKMKNYVLLDYEGKMTIKGSGLKSRGLEYFQRRFIEEMFELLLNDKKEEINKLLERYLQMILTHDWEVEWFQKSDTLQESLATYKDKIDNKKRNPAAVYELALQSSKDYSAGDRISYYITGNKASVTAYKNCKPAKLWDKNSPDENVKYYTSKLKSLHKKFSKLF